MVDDLVKGELTEATVQAVLKAIADVRAALPFLIDLTTDERRTLPKMGDKSRAFVEQALILAQQNADILPRNFDTDEFAGT